jgi:amidophosphoribosyltransferase
MDEFIAFKAAVALLEDRGMADVMSDIYEKAKEQEERLSDTRFADSFEAVNFVKEVYAPFTDSEISAKIAELLKPASTRAEVEIVYQTIEGLHESCPNNPGDWYFSGDYPTPGGTRMVNKAFINFMEKVYLRKTL